MTVTSRLPLLTVLFYGLAPTLMVSAQLLPPPPTTPNPTPPPGRFNPPPLRVDSLSNSLPAPDRAYSPAPNPSPVTLPLSPTPVTNDTLRVLVLVNNPMQEQEIRSLFPESFGIRHQGQRALQVGRFSDQANAQNIAHNLQNLGVRAVVVP
jgi:hypothetical protein